MSKDINKYTNEEIEYICKFFKKIIDEKGEEYISAFKMIFKEDLPKEIFDYVIGEAPMPIDER